MRTAFCILIALGAACVSTVAQQREVSGFVTTRDGAPKEDGSFRLPKVGAFVSFRHVDYKPLLVRSTELTDPVRVT